MTNETELLKSFIRARDIRGVRGLFFQRSAPTLNSGYYHESQLWDYKRDCPDKSSGSDLEWAKIAADVAAFHNRDGGVIFFGIRDKDFRFVGARPRLDTKLFNDKIRRYVGDRFWVSFSREFIQPDQSYLGVAVIPPRSVDHVRMLRDGPLAEGKPVFRRGDLCVRVGDETKTLRGSEAIAFSATNGLGAPQATYVVYEPNFRVLRPDYKQFVRREALCGVVERAMRSPRTFVTSLTGIGGIGKTALASWVTLAAFEQKQFDFIISVSARDRALTTSGIVATKPTLSSLADLLREICETTGFGEYAEIESEAEQVRLVREKILSNFPGLLFVDNLETVDDPRIVSFLEDLPLPARAIVTSRKAKIRIANLPVEVGPFELDEAITFLDETSRVVGREFFADLSRAEKEVVVGACDRIPLVIEWLVGRSRDGEKAMRLATQLDAHGKHGEELLEFSFRRVYEDLTEGQRLVLQVISMISQPLPIEAVAVAAKMPLHKASDALEELKEYSLIERLYEPNYRDLAYSLLPVTSTFVYRELKKRKGVESAIRRRLTHWYEARDIDDLGQRQLVQKVRRGERSPELTLIQVARNYLAQGDLDNAESYFEQALDRNPRNWRCHRELAEFYRHHRKATTSCLRHYKQAAELAPRQGPERGMVFREYGIVLRDSGHPSGPREAAENLEVALKEMPGDIICRHALGDCHVRMGFYEGAIEVLRPLLESKHRETRQKTYPLLERCYRATGRVLELQLLKDQAAKDQP